MMFLAVPLIAFAEIPIAMASAAALTAAAAVVLVVRNRRRMYRVKKSLLDTCRHRSSAGDVIKLSEVVAKHPDLGDLPEKVQQLTVIREAMASSTISYAAQNAPSADGTQPIMKLGDFLLYHLIGEGKFGKVYLGCSAIVANSWYAIKLVPKSHQTELAGVEEYFEAKGLHHPNLVPITYVGENGSHFYYCMDLAEHARGPDHRGFLPREYEALSLAWCVERRCLLPEEVLELAEAILSAVAHLHRLGKAHWDIKPANIVRINGNWCLGDVGLMTSSQPMRPRGTPLFWPPEVRDDLPINGKLVDLYAVGKTLFQALTGEDLSRFGEFAAGTLVMPGADKPEEQLRGIILRACDEDPKKRFANADEMRAAIASVMKARGIRHVTSRRRLSLIVLACTVFLILGAATWFISNALSSRSHVTAKTAIADRQLSRREASHEAARPGLPRLREFIAKSSKTTPRAVADWIFLCQGEVEAVVSGPEHFRATAAGDLPTGVIWLQRIKISGKTEVCDDDLPPLEPLDLQGLELQRTGLTDHGMRTIGSFRGLLWLSLYDVDISDHGVRRLKDLKKLKHLSLGATKITDEGLVVLENFPDLTDLYLRKTAVTDSCVPLICQCKRLLRLDIQDTNISQSGLNTLRAALPECEIKWSSRLGGTSGTP